MTKLRQLLTVLLLLLLVALGVLTGWVGARWWAGGGPTAPPDGPAVVLRIQSLSQLATVKYVIEKIVMAEDVKVYGESRVVLVAHGIVKAGVDLRELEPADVSVADEAVEITLPEPRILDAYLDEDQTRVLDHSTGLLRRFDKNLQQEARRKGLDAVRRAAEEAGILEEAKERLRFELNRLLAPVGVRRVTVHFREPRPDSPRQPGAETGAGSAESAG